MSRLLIPLLLSTLTTVPAATTQDVAPSSWPAAVYHDMAWGPQPWQHLEVYDADQNHTHGLVIYVHGGGWSAGDATDPLIPAIAALASRGWMVVSINYTLAPAATIPQQVDQVDQAVGFARSLFDGPIVTAGHSAGGLLVALQATKGQHRPDRTVVMAAPVDIAGWATASPYPETIPAVNVALGCSPSVTAVTCPPGVLASVDPRNFLDPTDPPAFLAYGDVDTIVPAAQGVMLESAWAAQTVCWFDSHGGDHSLTTVNLTALVNFVEAHQ